LNFFKMFNARSETVASKPIFKRLLSHNRCVVAYDGFYEWLVDEHKEKQPYFVHYGDNRPMLMAALYDTAHNRETLSDADTTASSSTDTPVASDSNDDDATRLYTYTVLTTNSSPRLEWLHDRMPVLLDANSAKQWIDPTVDASTLLPQLQPYNGDDLVWHPVTKAMNKVTYHGDDCTTAIELTADTPTKDGSKPITAFFSKQAKSPQKQSSTTGSSSSSDGSAVKAATPTAASKGKAKRVTPTTTAAASGSSSSAQRAKTSSSSKASNSSAKHSAAATDSDADIQEAVARSLEQLYNKGSSSRDNTANRDTQQHADDVEFERQMQQALAASMGSSSDTYDTTTSTTTAAAVADSTGTSSSGSKRKSASAMHTQEHDEQRISKAVKAGDDSSAPCTNSK
jgi:putative SOS response-associated peptidase YedK